MSTTKEQVEERGATMEAVRLRALELLGNEGCAGMVISMQILAICEQLDALKAENAVLRRQLAALLAVQTVQARESYHGLLGQTEAKTPSLS